LGRSRNGSSGIINVAVNATITTMRLSKNTWVTEFAINIRIASGRFMTPE
jgi:hypothetical protein